MSTIVMPGGINADCDKAIGSMKVPIITRPDAKWTDRIDFINTESWRVKIQEDLSVYVPRPIQGSENTPSEVVNETTGFGKQVTTRATPGSIIAFFESNSCDFNELMESLNGQVFRVISFTENGRLHAMGEQDGSVRGFEYQLFAVPMGPRGQDNLTQQWRVQMNAVNVEQFRQTIVVDSPRSARSLLEWMPAGLTAVENTPYDTGTGIQIMNVSKRCEPNVIEIDVLTGEVVDLGTEVAPVITPTSNTDGTYDVLIDAPSLTHLAEGEWIKYRLVKLNGLIFEKISNTILVNPNV